MNIKSLFLIAAIMLLTACGGDLGRDKHVIGPFEVIDVGACVDTSWGCTSKVSGFGMAYFAKTSSPTMVGMKVYRECWTESDGRHCFRPFTVHPRKGFRKGGVRTP